MVTLQARWASGLPTTKSGPALGLYFHSFFRSRSTNCCTFCFPFLRYVFVLFQSRVRVGLEKLQILTGRVGGSEKLQILTGWVGGSTNIDGLGRWVYKYWRVGSVGLQILTGRVGGSEKLQILMDRVGGSEKLQILTGWVGGSEKLQILTGRVGSMPF